MRDIWGESRPLVERAIMVYQAGEIARRKALSITASGRWTYIRLTAIHEAGHALAETVLNGKPPASVSLEEFDTPEGRMVQGLTSLRADAEPTPGRPVGTPADEVMIESFCRSLEPEWEAFAAELAKRVEPIISADWPAILSLSLELSGRDIIYRAEIESIVASARLRAAETHLG